MGGDGESLLEIQCSWPMLAAFNHVYLLFLTFFCVNGLQLRDLGSVNQRLEVRVVSVLFWMCQSLVRLQSGTGSLTPNAVVFAFRACFTGFSHAHVSSLSWTCLAQGASGFQWRKFFRVQLFPRFVRVDVDRYDGR